MLKISCAVVKYIRGPRPLRFGLFSSSATLAEDKNSPYSREQIKNETKTYQRTKEGNPIIAAAFASLQNESGERDEFIKTPQTDDKIVKAKTVDELLTISGGNGVSRRHALKVVSVLAQWSSSGKVRLSDFEHDARFIKLCRVLTKTTNKYNKNVSRSEDLSTILNITADDEAAKLVGSITLPQMVKVMSSLSLRKRRSTLLLRSLSYNITANPERLNIKQCADLLFSITSLNYPDENLLAKICCDVCLGLKDDIKKSSVVGSIVTSMGLLKYKNPDVLDVLSDWIVKNNKICRPHDIFSLFVSLAALNYKPANSEELFHTLVPQLSISESRNPQIWLDVVWSLIALNQANHAHISSVLDGEFLNKMEGSKSLSVPTKLKFLNIDCAAQFLIDNYDGPRLPQNSSLRSVNLTRSGPKTEMVEILIATLRNLIQSDNHLKVNINSGLGFFIDAKIVMDQKCTPLPVNEDNESRSDAIKIAVMCYDYHDMCIGKVEPNGVNAFAGRLLEAQGYKILAVPYTDFALKDKLVHRVQYLESKLKEIVK